MPRQHSVRPPVDDNSAPATRKGPHPTKAKQAAASEVNRRRLKILTAAAVPAAPAASPVRGITTRIHPTRRVVGHVGVEVVALRAWGIGLHGVGREEATQRRIEFAGPQNDQAGGGIGQFTGVAKGERRSK